MNIYLMHAIDRNKEPGILVDFLSEFHTRVREVNSSYKGDIWEDYAIFTPSGAYEGVFKNWGTAEQYIISVNHFALQKATAAILFYQPGVESWGVPQELKAFWPNPVFIYVKEAVWNPIPDLPMYLVKYAKKDMLCSSVPDLVNKMSSFFAGEHTPASKPNTEPWRTEKYDK